MGTGVGCAAVVVLGLLLVITGFATGAVNVSTEGLIVTDSGYPGGSVTIIEVLKNKGDSSSGSEKVTYYLVNESEQNATPVQIGTTDLSPISAEGEYSSANTYMLPMNLADGVYTFVREVMGSDKKTSSGKTIRISDSTRPSGKPADLVGLGVITPRQAAPGETIRLIAAVGNNGGADAGRFSVDFYLTNRSMKFSEPLLLGTWDIESIPAGGQATTTRSVTIPTTTPPGEYGILMDVDPSRAVTDSTPSNNDWYREGVISITGPTIAMSPFPSGMMINTTSSVIVVPNNTSTQAVYSRD
ncbi:MAG TPA: CARDB domain-containing protein [Methanospirillum sp.]|uniref:CARDB domain-containing protein n=1 Tax=Methanospirillum sp. TaxID=45200 RepID=UPI002B95B51C|nr:CARDB domain-containing protein [Methanospirillum sp.]HWQ64540.1 CARDB domain-containing protein [Methanospirillum sp.]